MNHVKLFAGALMLAVSAPAMAQSFVPAGNSPVIDAANVLEPSQEAALREIILANQKRTGNEIAIATVPSLEGQEIADYGVKYFRFLGIGNKKDNDGVLFLIAPSDRKMNITVGYGLEGTLTDAVSSSILREYVRPQFKAGNIYAGIQHGTMQIIAAASPEAQEAAAKLAARQQQQAKETAEQLGTFLTWFLGIPLLGGGAFGLYWICTAGKRERKRREKEAARMAAFREQMRLDRERRDAQERLRIAQQEEKARKERERRAALTPEQRAAEEDRELKRLAAQVEADRREYQKRRAEEDEKARKKAAERSSYSSSSYNDDSYQRSSSSSSYSSWDSSSSSSSSSSWGGFDGGSSGGGGASSDW